MIPNNNLSVLPWYGSIGEQNARKWWVYGRIYPLFTPAGYLPPFQILREHRVGGAIMLFRIYKSDGTLVGTYTSAMDGAVTVKHFDALGYDVIVFPGTAQIAPGLSNGQYYAEISDGTQTWYSEVFTAVNDISPYLKITWWDEDDFTMDAGTIVYKSPAFKNTLYLDATIAKPDYPFEEEGETRDGYFFPIKQISEKRYRFSFLASEYLLDVMRFIRMADHAQVTLQGKTYTLDSFLITPEWEAEGDVAAVQAEFDTATVAKKISLGATPTPEAPYITLSVNSWNPLAEGDTMLLAIMSNASWSVSGAPAWLTLSENSGTGDALMQLTAAANGTGASRSATLVFTTTGGQSAGITITQYAEDTPFLSISPSSWEAPQAGGTTSIVISANVAWELSGLPAWLMASASSGSGSGQIGLTALANSTGADRSATLTFSAQGLPDVTLSVTQPAATAPYLSLDTNSLSVGEAGDATTVELYANVAWSASNIPAWVTISPSSGSGRATLVVQVQANHGSVGNVATARSATITFSGSGVPDVTLTISQAAPVVNSLTPSTASFDADGGSFALAINAIGDWTLNPGSGVSVNQITGNGNANVTVTVAANTSGSAVTKTLGISLDDNPDAVCPTVTISQSATVALKVLKFTAAGGNMQLSFAGTFDSLQWSEDNGQGWTNWDGTAKSISSGNSLQVRGYSNTFSGQFTMTGSGTLACEGSVMGLVDLGSGFTAIPANVSFANLFDGCDKLTSAPELPATTLRAGCYKQMFRGCSLLVTAPSLPAVNLVANCYEEMFYECLSLTSAPLLPASILADSCYKKMFSECYALETAPELPAATLVAHCYEGMFDASGINFVKCLAHDVSATDCTLNWLRDVAATGIFVYDAGYSNIWGTGASGIPAGWTSGASGDLYCIDCGWVGTDAQLIGGECPVCNSTNFRRL